MRFYYADPGLLNNLGHHASSCRFITRELRTRAIETSVLGFVRVEPDMQAELGAIPFFRSFTYWITDGDPVCGWLNAHYAVAQTTRDDLTRLVGLGPGDLLYLNSGQAAQLFGVAQWLAGLPPDKLPHVVFEFGVDAGVDVKSGPGGMTFSTRDPRRDARGILLRHAACQIPKAAQSRCHIITFDASSSAAYQALLSKPVGVLPLPRVGVTALRNRAGKRPITVAVLGHQRPDKGYQFMPEVSKRLLDAHTDIKFLAHNGDPAGMLQTQQAMRAMAAIEPRLSIDERVAEEKTWAELLDQAGVILCPYDQATFATRYSAVAAEAIANAIPLVVPAGSSIARMMAEFGGAGTTFGETEPTAIVEAVHQALATFDQIATVAMAGARKWSQAHGPRHFVDAMLDLVKKT